MPDYQKGKIYKLVSDHTDEIYIGSTIQSYLSSRLGGHKRDCKTKKNPCNSKKLFDLGDVKIVLIENVPCNSKEELYKRERHYIETTNCVNKLIPGRTMAENYQDKKEHYQQKSHDRYHANKEEILKQQATPVVCECGLTSTKSHLKRHRQTKRHLDLMESKTHQLTPSSLQSLH